MNEGSRPKTPSRPKTSKPQSKRLGTNRGLRFSQSMRNDESKKIGSEEREWMRNAEELMYSFQGEPSNKDLERILKYDMLTGKNLARALLIRNDKNNRIKPIKKRINKVNNKFLSMLETIEEEMGEDIISEIYPEVYEANEKLKFFQKKKIMQRWPPEVDKILASIKFYIKKNEKEGMGKKRKTKRKRKSKRKRKTKRKRKRKTKRRR